MQAEFIDRYRGRQPEWGFNGLGYVVYKRTYARPVEGEDRSEEWYETVERVVDGAQAIGAGLTDDEAERLYDHIFNLRCSVSGRALWQLGTDNVTRLGGDSLVNCWHVVLRTPEDFAFLFNELMLGGGVGFTVDTDHAPLIRGGKVTHLEGATDADFIVPDKREGWANLLVRTLEAYIEGEEFTYSTVLIRPEGAPIKTFGGVASGPGILVEGIDHITRVLDRAVGSKLSTVDVLDIANIIGSIVVSGNVRRSAQIALAPAERDYLLAKRWDLDQEIPYWRAMSNNTVVTSDIDELPDLFWAGYHGNGEPYGLFNLDASRLYGRMGEEDPDPSIEGVNPCGEIPLADHESCNLAEIFLPRVESETQFRDIALLLYKVQKAVAALPYLDIETSQIVRQNMRLGLSITGVAQAAAKLDWLSSTYEMLREFDKAWSAERDLNPSIRLTTIKPSGTLSLLAGVTPGIHPGFSRYHIRRVRMASNDALVGWCRSQGYHVEYERFDDGAENRRTMIVEFPCEFPEGTWLADDASAIDQLEMQARLQRDWADNAVSISVYYRKDELPGIKDYLRANWSRMKSVSFILHSGHGWDQAVLEEIDEEEYRDRMHRIQWTTSAARGVSSLSLDDDDCATGACPIR
jgi:ribonucleotide reductase alpha subunit